MIKGKQQRRVDRKSVQTGTLPTAPLVGVVSVKATAPSLVDIVFEATVNISADRLPTSWKFGTGLHAITAINSGSGTTWSFTVGGTIASAQPYLIAGNDPAARTATGGYVASAAGSMT